MMVIYQILERHLCHSEERSDEESGGVALPAYVAVGCAPRPRFFATAQNDTSIYFADDHKSGVGARSPA